MALKLLDEYQAAALIGISPELLRYLTTHQVKWQDKRKLIAAKKVNDTLYFEEAELKAYDAWLRAPWPFKDNKRPGLPDPIREEIRQEANLECALCKSSGQAGEAAHIDPVKTSKNNHPHNLIWLCSNHHTKFDNGCFGPKGADNKVVAALKQGLHHFKRTAWQGQAEVSKQIAATLSLCSMMKKQLASATTTVEVEAIEGIAAKALALIPKLASQATSDSVQPTLKRLASKLTAGEAKSGNSTKAQLETVASFEEEFLLKSGLKHCPLCNGAKTHNGYDCPVCNGDGAVSEDLEVDLCAFESVDCQLCSGTGRLDGEDCPVCRGDGELERRVSERVDFSMYEPVRCPLCKGKGKWQDEDCPPCSGEGTMSRGAAEQVDLQAFDEVDCPLCEGQGRYEGEDCPECHGDRKMQRQYADQIDLSKHELKRCPLCKGKRHYLNEDCPACNGDGRLPAGAAEQLDISLYELVKCPHCRGTGAVNDDECPACGGDRKIQRRFADRL